MAVTLNLQTPCHKRLVRIVATESVPVEKYERRCRCGFEWQVTRETLQEGAVRMDRVTWEEAK
jgi:hypothetical protein